MTLPPSRRRSAALPRPCRTRQTASTATTDSIDISARIVAAVRAAGLDPSRVSRDDLGVVRRVPYRRTRLHARARAAGGAARGTTGARHRQRHRGTGPDARRGIRLPRHRDRRDRSVLCGRHDAHRLGGIERPRRVPSRRRAPAALSGRVLRCRLVAELDDEHRGQGGPVPRRSTASCDRTGSSRSTSSWPVPRPACTSRRSGPRRRSLNFLVPPDELRRLLTAEGFEVRDWRDQTAARLESAKRRQEKAAEPGPVLGREVIVTEDVPLKIENSVRNTEGGHTLAFRVVAVRSTGDPV